MREDNMNTDEKETTISGPSSHHHSLPEHHVPLSHHHHEKYNWIRIFARRYAHASVTAILALALILVLAIQYTGSMSSTSNNAALAVKNDSIGPNSTVVADDVPWAPLPDPSQSLSRIAFGSCMKEDMPMPFWDTLLEFQPDVTILGGDQVYGLEKNACSGHDNCTLLELAYQQLNSHPSFQGAKRRLPMVGMPDDHDYGLNDCYIDNPYKDIAKQMYLDFMDIPQTDDRWHRPNDGLYTSYEWGSNNQIVQLTMLDTRYSRSKFLYDHEKWGYKPYTEENQHNKRFLSEAQWQWLEEVLQRPANVRLILSTQQVLTQGVWGFENWNNIPKERRRLVRLLKKYCHANTKKRSVPILLSGDRHIGAFYNDPDLWSDLYEVTASSWTHTIPDGWDPDGVKCHHDNPGDCIEEDATRLGDWVGVNHFGMVDLDWEARTVQLSLIRAETSHAYYVKKRWKYNTDAGEILKSMTLKIP
jgi:alkaline phosphatase D